MDSVGRSHSVDECGRNVHTLGLYSSLVPKMTRGSEGEARGTSKVETVREDGEPEVGAR